MITPENAATTLKRIDDSTLRIFCVTPGDYRAAGRINLLASGSPTAPRILRLHADDGLKAIQRTEQAVFEQILLRGDWWVIQGIALIPRNPATEWFVAILRGDYNVLDGNLLDGIEHPNVRGQTGIFVGSLSGDPAVGNSIQANVIRRGNMARVSGDYTGIIVSTSREAGGDNDRTLILDNEIYDWGDSIQVADYGETTCTYGGRPRGTLIEGNDLYLTGDKRIDCTTGAPNPNGDCSCAENAIDVKPTAGADPSEWTRVINNRIWGFRPTRNPSVCGGSGSNGQAIAGSACSSHLLVAGNAVLDSTAGLYAVGSSWIVTGNLFHGLHFPPRSVWSGALLAPPSGAQLRFEFNTVVSVDNAYDDASPTTDTRCNVVVDNLAVNNNGNPRGVDHVTEHNFLYHSPAANFVGTTNEVYPTAAHSENEPFCFWRRRWTAPELVCVPFVRPTTASPQNTGVAHCTTGLVEAFGLGRVDYTSVGSVPEPGAAAAGSAALVALAGAARQRRRREPVASTRTRTITPR